MENLDAAKGYIYNTEGTRRNGRYTSARFDNPAAPRLDKARDQAELTPASTERIIELTNKFLCMCGIDCVEVPEVGSDKLKNKKEFYEQVEIDRNLKDKRDIVWMKFTCDGFLGVVASSADINFQIPESDEDYLKKKNGMSKYSKWAFNNSGIIIHRLEKQWCEDYVLVFPLSNIPDDLTRGHIECGIGNYLIANNVPILDYFSHRFQSPMFNKEVRAWRESLTTSCVLE